MAFGKAKSNPHFLRWCVILCIESSLRQRKSCPSLGPPEEVRLEVRQSFHGRETEAESDSFDCTAVGPGLSSLTGPIGQHLPRHSLKTGLCGLAAGESLLTPPPRDLPKSY